MGDLFLGIDVGTKNIKVAILSGSGRVVERASEPVYDLLLQPEENFVERDPERLWSRLIRALGKLTGLGDVAGVCVDGTSGTIVPIDEEGNALHRLIMYNDSRAAEEAERLRRASKAAREYEKYLPITPQMVLPKLMWLKENFAEFHRIYKVLHESDYFVYRLTGEIATSSNTAGKAHALLDGEGYLGEAYEDAGIPLDLMPRIEPIGAPVGKVTEEAAGTTGIPEGTPVVNGMTDASSGDLTSGCIKPGQVSVTIGTALTVHAIVGRAVPDPHKRFYYKTYVMRNFLAGGFTNAGTPALDTFSRLVGRSLDALTEDARAVPPGSSGLYTCTELFGVRVPFSNPALRGFIVGLTEKNYTYGHLFRSMLEGSSYALRLMLGAVEDTTETRFYDLRVSGGASRNDLFMQIVADVSGIPVVTVQEPDSAVGSAMLAAWGAGGIPIGEIVDRTVKIRKKFEPDPEKVKVYLEKVGKYRRMVEALSRALG